MTCSPNDDDDDTITLLLADWDDEDDDTNADAVTMAFERITLDWLIANFHSEYILRMCPGIQYKCICPQIHPKAMEKIDAQHLNANICRISCL